MCKCWNEDSEKRPEFTEISKFMNSFLTGETLYFSDPDEEFEYSYVRNVTKFVPDMYLAYEESSLAADNYIDPADLDYCSAYSDKPVLAKYQQQNDVIYVYKAEEVISTQPQEVDSVSSQNATLHSKDDGYGFFIPFAQRTKKSENIYTNSAGFENSIAICSNVQK